jgi:hypothetical protein
LGNSPKPLVDYCSSAFAARLPGVLTFASDGSLHGPEIVELRNGQMADFATCSTAHEFTSEIKANFVQAGSVICVHDPKEEVVGAFTIKGLPNDDGPSRYWVVSAVVWRGAMN